MFGGYLHAISQVIPQIDDYTDGLDLLEGGSHVTLTGHARAAMGHRN